ncbi:hypothetical protein FAF44_03000 [Nonomuraea sp. MG754425]|uniref:hypothetical protein n=1 Tax=Nonomuraea sp. MG754425 TaxID=2570319 RepID=UPI001F17A02E|nr:hypothetical protein [Nonomuraea sp. MG754425]MCF6467383.1 hypothetical protein [Nonomuraea sp. MG754425]
MSWVEMAERPRNEQLAFVRAGTQILVSKMMLVTGLTEGEIARAVMEAANLDGVASMSGRVTRMSRSE